MIEICQVKYLNNIIEQDHQFIKKITKPMMGFKAFHSAQATIAGIETAHMIRKNRCLSGVKRFKSHHWFGYFFDKLMVLFDNIIQIFNLAYLDHSGKSSQD
jgi:hypothetical protein